MPVKKTNKETGEVTVDKSASLVAKLALIMGEVEAMKKDGRNEHFKFDFISVNAMMDLIRPKMAREGIIMYPSVKEWSLEPAERGKVCHMVFEWVITDGNETLEPRPSTIGEANDSSDKAANKAQTAAQKQLYMKLFQLSADDDNDGHAETTQYRPQAARTATPRQPQGEKCPEHNLEWRKTSRGTTAHPIKDETGDLLGWCDEKEWKAQREAAGDDYVAMPEPQEGDVEQLPW